MDKEKEVQTGEGDSHEHTTVPNIRILLTPRGGHFHSSKDLPVTFLETPLWGAVTLEPRGKWPTLKNCQFEIYNLQNLQFAKSFRVPSASHSGVFFCQPPPLEGVPL